MTKEKEKGFWANIIGQDLIEYALMAAFVAVAAGAIMPGVAHNIKQVFEKISCSWNGGQSVVAAKDLSGNTYYRCVMPVEGGR